MLLKEGNIVELKQGHKVYAEIPSHFVFENRVGCFDLAKTEVPVGGNKNGLNTDYLVGRWVVVRTEYGGGGTGHGAGDVYPDGHKVTCEKIVDHSWEYKIRVSFYQTGCFTAMIREDEIDVVGQAQLSYTISD